MGVVSRPMAWKNAVNGALRTLTGYQLARPQVPAPRVAAQPAPAAPAAPARPKGLRLPADYDDEAKEIIRAVKPWTMTSPERLNAFVLATRHVVQHGIPGDIVECGVWRGGSMQACAKALLGRGVTDRDLYLFDTYDGMTPPTVEDLRRDGTPASDILARNDKDKAIWAYATLDDVKSGFQQVPYPAERVHFVQGKVEETVPGRAPDKIAVLRLDTDWYASTKHELDHLYDRLVPGGVLLIDDYGYWQGSRQAVDEFLEKTGERLLLLRMDEGRIAVKP
ncbi:macrocin-O-methyltransferase TylF [Streptomyces sp. PsTaAH-137]|nr:macrocin-O-methyltransferase TylF [Streptomyces sp. PsTaAH-137]